VKGRGVLKLDGVYEFQTAYIAPPDEVFDAVRALCAELAREWTGERAQKVPILPEKFDADFLNGAPVDLKRFPAGVNKHSLAIEYTDLTADFATFISANDSDGVPAVLYGIMEVAGENAGASVTLVEDEASVVALKDLMVERHTALKQSPGAEFERRLFVIDSIANLFGGLSEEGAHHLGDLLANGRPEMGIHMVIGESVSNLQGYNIEAWYRAQFNGNGIWVGDGAADQFLMNINSSGSDLRGELGASFGALNSKGKYKLVKLLQGRSYGGEDAA
jgi:S-DNA-T family DNA segregation ATPase FtsK/SpoIIIE